MGIEHIMPKTKHIFPNNCILLVLFLLPFFIKIIAVIIKAIISTKIAIMKYQNKIMLGAFSIINISQSIYTIHYTTPVDFQINQKASPLDILQND